MSKRKVLIICIDAGGHDYLAAGEVPNMRRLAEAGFYQHARSVIPSVTNVNKTPQPPLAPAVQPAPIHAPETDGTHSLRCMPDTERLYRRRPASPHTRRGSLSQWCHLDSLVACPTIDGPASYQKHHVGSI